jgi:hypothetical protein
VAIAEERPPGRDDRRRYSVFDLIYLSLLREFAGTIPLAAAGLVSVQGLKPELSELAKSA